MRDALDRPSAPGDPWPSAATFGPEGLRIAGARALELAERYGTPLLVVDEEHLRARCRAFAELFPHPLYAVKAFTSRGAIRIAAEEGLDLLAATRGELEACLRAGVPAERIVLHGNNKSERELHLAVDEGIRLVNVDNRDELQRLSAIAEAAGVEQPILIRVVPEIVAGGHEKIRTGHRGSKFGLPLEEVPDAVSEAVALPGVRPLGIHAHVGSQVLEPGPFLEAVDVLLDLLVRVREVSGCEAEVLDLGGGFGVAYTDESPPSLETLAPALLGRVREGARSRGLAVPHVLVEPGRAVVGGAMVTLYRVGAVKRAGERLLVAVDGGMSDNIRPMLYGARYTVAPAGTERPGGPTTVDVVGKHCESGDLLARDVRLPWPPQRDDLLAFAATGAYTYSMASNYNRVGRPAVVAVRRGEVRPWLRREDPADLDRLEVALEDRPMPEPPAEVEVRPARPADTDSFLDAYRSVAAERRFIQTEVVTGTPRQYRRTFRRAWTSEEATLMALAAGRVVGSLSIRRDPQGATRHVATLGMFVLDGWRGRGVGSALMAEALRWARAQGVRRVELTVYPHNRAALALYRRFGFVEEGRLIRHARKSYGYEDEILMAVWLGSEGA
ncbi:MAG TPA: diaminopimelate decarboxylase [Actinomycetota bacterium]|jgi:diaminopimelate decarboxylase|nr:diaminopimelate decarboxylase [Actinomycetota bacterium]